MKFIVAADTQIGLYSHFSNIKDKSEIRTNSIEFVKLDFLNLKPTTSFNFEISNFNKLRNENYSLDNLNLILKEIDKIASERLYDFIE